MPWLWATVWGCDDAEERMRQEPLDCPDGSEPFERTDYHEWQFVDGDWTLLKDGIMRYCGFYSTDPSLPFDWPTVELHGPWQHWVNGYKRGEGQFRYGHRTGAWRHYRSDGSLHEIDRWEADQWVAEIRYDRSGNVVGTPFDIDVETGMCPPDSEEAMGPWEDLGWVRYCGFFTTIIAGEEAGRTEVELHGPVRYFEGHTLRVSGQFDRGVRDGLWGYHPFYPVRGPVERVELYDAGELVWSVHLRYSDFGETVIRATASRTEPL